LLGENFAKISTTGQQPWSLATLEKKEWRTKARTQQTHEQGQEKEEEEEEEEEPYQQEEEEGGGGKTAR
jgi:hypothetical protein